MAQGALCPLTLRPKLEKNEMNTNLTTDSKERPIIETCIERKEGTEYHRMNTAYRQVSMPYLRLHLDLNKLNLNKLAFTYDEAMEKSWQLTGYYC